MFSAVGEDSLLHKAEIHLQHKVLHSGSSYLLNRPVSRWRGRWSASYCIIVRLRHARATSTLARVTVGSGHVACKAYNVGHCTMEVLDIILGGV